MYLRNHTVATVIHSRLLSIYNDAQSSNFSHYQPVGNPLSEASTWSVCTNELRQISLFKLMRKIIIRWYKVFHCFLSADTRTWKNPEVRCKSWTSLSLCVSVSFSVILTFDHFCYLFLPTGSISDCLLFIYVISLCWIHNSLNSYFFFCTHHQIGIKQSRHDYRGTSRIRIEYFIIASATKLKVPSSQGIHQFK